MSNATEHFDEFSELRCPECEAVSLVGKWDDCEAPCDDCGSHSAIMCPNCGECFDLINCIVQGISKS